MHPLVQDFAESVRCDLRRMAFVSREVVGGISAWLVLPEPFPRLNAALLELIEGVEELARKYKRPPLAWNVYEQGPVPSKYGHIQIYHNGKRIQDVVAYDVEAGWLLRHKRDKTGNLVIGTDRVMTERLTGRIIAQRVN